MQRIDWLRLWLAILISLCLFAYVNGCNYAKAADVARNDVKIIAVTESSNYIIDKTWKLCFYETKSPYAISVVSVPCDKFKLE